MLEVCQVFLICLCKQEPEMTFTLLELLIRLKRHMT